MELDKPWGRKYLGSLCRPKGGTESHVYNVTSLYQGPRRLLEWKHPTVFPDGMSTQKERHVFSDSTVWENMSNFALQGLQIKVKAVFHCLTREIPMPSSNSKYLQTSARPCLPARWQPPSGYVRPPCLPAAFLSCVSQWTVLVIFSKVGCEERSGSAYRTHSDTNQILGVCIARARRGARDPAPPSPPLFGTRVQSFGNDGRHERG